MKPQEILKAKKELGILKIEDDNPFFTLPLTIDGKPIELEVEGDMVYGSQFRMNNWDQFKLCIEADADMVLLSKNLINDLKYLLSQETLPYFKLVINNFVNQDQHTYVHWPKSRKQFSGVMVFPDEEIYYGPNDPNYKNFQAKLQEKKRVSVLTELYVWCRQDHENHELQVGFTPKVKSIFLGK